jgi:DNA-binding transcriptional regulator GbsR (MarR family)
MKKTNLKKMIGNKAHWTINKTLSRKIGLIETLVLQHLIDLQSVFEREEIFQPYSEMCEELGITEYAIKQSIGKLNSLRLIRVERKSVGFKNFYKVNEDIVEDMMLEEQLTSEVNSTHQRGEGVSELEIESQRVENYTTSELNSTLSELKTNPQRVENYTAITNNTTNNTLERINKKNTTAGSSGNIKNITEKIVDVLVDYESDIVKYNRAIDDMNELGGIDGISEILEWDDKVKENWKIKIQNVYNIK